MVDNLAWICSVDLAPEVIAGAVEAGLGAVNQLPSRGESWAIKLNLTYPIFLPGVVNAPEFVEGLCRWAVIRSIRLIFIEGDGGNGSYSAQDAFDGNGVTTIATRYGMKCVSISEKPWEWRETWVAGRIVRLPYSPFFRRKEYDRLITAPLFKNHIFTVVTLGMKNLYGCIPDAYRMYYHYFLDAAIIALCKELRPNFSIFDGLTALRGRGPMDGEPVGMHTIMVSSNVGAGEAAALRIMGVPLGEVHHLQLAHKEGLMPLPEQVQWLSDPTSIQRSDFILDRSWLNHVSIWIAQLPRLQRWVYHSAFSRFLYAIVNPLRPESAQADLVRAKLARKRPAVSTDER